uniref:Uncharacterized protein n=1 Tax=Panagrellus redivivus TaxID=6233 RepID=A0A7E4VMB9_PANRE
MTLAPMPGGTLVARLEARQNPSVGSGHTWRLAASPFSARRLFPRSFSFRGLSFVPLGHLIKYLQLNTASDSPLSVTDSGANSEADDIYRLAASVSAGAQGGSDWFGDETADFFDDANGGGGGATTSAWRGESASALRLLSAAAAAANARAGTINGRAAFARISGGYDAMGNLEQLIALPVACRDMPIMVPVAFIGRGCPFHPLQMPSHFYYLPSPGFPSLQPCCAHHIMADGVCCFGVPSSQPSIHLSTFLQTHSTSIPPFLVLAVNGIPVGYEPKCHGCLSTARIGASFFDTFDVSTFFELCKLKVLCVRPV